MADRPTDPRVTQSQRVVRRAALAELAEVGYGGFTIESVAARCGVARSTIYRHWPDKLALVADALRSLNRQPRPTDGADGADGIAPADDAGGAGGIGPIEGGSPRAHVGRLVRHLAEAFRGSVVADCLPAMIEGAERHEELRALHHRYNAERRNALVEAVAAAVAAGEVAEGVDPELASLALAGPVVYRRLMTGDPFDPADVDRLVDLVLGPPPGR